MDDATRLEREERPHAQQRGAQGERALMPGRVERRPAERGAKRDRELNRRHHEAAASLGIIG